MYNLINTRLENISREYNLLYWKHIIENATFNSRSFKKETISFFYNKEINSFIENSFKQSNIKENLYAYGNSIPWKERIERTLSQPFTLSYFWGINDTNKKV